MTTFTKGNWKLRGEEIGIVSNSDDQSYGMMLTIARVDQYDFKDDWESNARLIEQSPNLYNMVKELSEMMDKLNEGFNSDCKAIELSVRAESLLKKVKG